MTYEDIFGRCLEKQGGGGLFAAVLSRPADCKPDEPGLLAQDDRRGNLEYKVRVYVLGRKIHLMDRIALALGYAAYLRRLPAAYRYYRCARHQPLFDGGFRRSVDEAYSSALHELAFPPGAPRFGWSSPEECELKMEAAGLL